MQPLEGYSMAPTFIDKAHNREVLYWEHEGNRAVRRGKWKLVCEYPGDWELYDMSADRTEMHDLSTVHPDMVSDLCALYERWAARCNVLPWDELLEARNERRQDRGDE